MVELVLFLLILLALAGVFIYGCVVIAKRVWRWRPPHGRWVVVLAVGAFVAYSSWSTYRAFYPSESFYRAEFEREAGFALPASARFVAGSASYPDHFGDYCSAAVFELEPDSWEMLPGDLDPSTGEAARGLGSVCLSVVKAHVEEPLEPRTATLVEGGRYFSWGKHEPSRRVLFHFASW